jgi:hypothetical protein
MPEKYPTEALTEEEAHLRYPGQYILVSSIYDQDGDCRDAVFVWRTAEAAADEDPVALYWLK